MNIGPYSVLRLTPAERARQKEAQEAIRKILARMMKERKSGWEFVEVGRLRRKKHLTLVEKKTLRKLERELREQAEKASHTNRMPRCTCLGLHRDPRCPLHHLIGPKH